MMTDQDSPITFTFSDIPECLKNQTFRSHFELLNYFLVSKLLEQNNLTIDKQVFDFTVQSRNFNVHETVPTNNLDWLALQYLEVVASQQPTIKVSNLIDSTFILFQNTRKGKSGIAAKFASFLIEHQLGSKIVFGYQIRKLYPPSLGNEHVAFTVYHHIDLIDFIVNWLFQLAVNEKIELNIGSEE